MTRRDAPTHRAPPRSLRPEARRSLIVLGQGSRRPPTRPRAPQPLVRQSFTNCRDPLGIHTLNPAPVNAGERLNGVLFDRQVMNPLETAVAASPLEASAGMVVCVRRLGAGWKGDTTARILHCIAPVAACAVLAACGGGASLGHGAIQKTFDVGGRSLYLECAGKGSPTVVMDAGLGNTHETWQAVAPAVRKLTRTCTYDRANLGKSDSTSKPRTSADVVADLHRLLAAAHIRPPYLLVGHSFGGLNVRLFAAEHPTEVSGIILVDPTPTTFLSGECALVSAALCRELQAGWDPDNNPEGLDYLASSKQVEAAANLPRVPVIVLAATDHQQDAITDPDVEKRIEALWQRSQQQLATEAHGRVIVVPSGHDIQLLKPEAVMGALRSLLHQPASQ